MSTSLSIQCSTLIYVTTYLGLYSYALFASTACPYQSRIAEVVRSGRWLLVTVFWFCVVMQVTEHVLTKEGKPMRIQIDDARRKKSSDLSCWGSFVCALREAGR